MSSTVFPNYILFKIIRLEMQWKVLSQWLLFFLTCCLK